MAPQMTRIVCNQCNAWYSSQSELRDHMRVVHRAFGFGQSSFENASLSRPETEVENPVTEDLFEAARKAFFGTGIAAPGANVSPASPFEPRNHASQAK
jgi:hypothetical protein